MFSLNQLKSMKRILLPFVILLFFNPANLFAQENDSIRNVILNSETSDLEMIAKGRSLTLDHLLTGDLYALKEVKEYLTGEKGNPYSVYLPVEYWLLSFWTEEYQTLLQEARLFATDIDWQNSGYWEMSERFRPSSLLRMISENDQLLQEVGRKSAESYLPLTVTIDAATLSNEEKAFLKLWLYALLFTPERVDNEAEMTELNAMADTFLENYRESDYADYTRRFIRYRFRPGNWGFGYELFLGYNTLTEGLNRHFGNSVAGGFAFNMLYRDFELSLRFNYASAKTKREVIHRDIIWPTDVGGYLVGADLSLQYPLYQSRDLKLMPFVGIGGMGIGPTDAEIKNHPELDDFRELSTLNYLVGLELKLNSWNREVDLSRSGGSYLGIRYSYYMPNYNRKHELLEGNMHMITLSFGGFGRPVKREL